MDKKHSPEPWKYDGRKSTYDANGDEVVSSEEHPWVPEEADARRIVACVNACKRIPTEALEAGVLDVFVWHVLLRVRCEDCKTHPLVGEGEFHKGAALIKEHGGDWEELC